MKRLFLIVLITLLARGQVVNPYPRPLVPSGGSGTGTVTSVTAGCGLSGGPVISTGTISASIATAAHNGSYAVLTGDCGKSLTTNTAAAWTIAQAGTTGFEAGKYWLIENVGAGSLSLTATTSTFYGGPTAQISGSVLTVAANSGATIISDGTNYQVIGGGGGGSGVTSIALAGTADQITLTGTCTITTTGTCTFSLPSALQIPGTINKLTLTQPATGATVTVIDGKALTVNKTLTFDGTDGVTLTFPATSATIARTDAGQTFTGAQTFSATIVGSINGNAATATALAANGTNCSAGNYPLGVDAAGNSESCTAAASAANPTFTGVMSVVSGVPATGFQNITDNPLSAGATSITVSSTTGFPAAGLLLLAISGSTTTNELVAYTSTDATHFLGVTRGLYGTTGSSHAASTFAIPIETIITPSVSTLPEMLVAHWNSTQVIIYGSPLLDLGTPAGLIINDKVSVNNTLSVTGGVGYQGNFYQDAGSAKGYWQTSASGINWDNINRVVGNVNVSLDAVTSQTANVLQMRNATPAITTAFSPTTGQVNTYNTVATAGMGVPPIYAYTTLTGQTASVGATNLQCGGAVCPAGLYRVHIYDMVTATGTGTLTTTVGWTDPAQAQTKTSAGVATTAKNFESIDYVVRADGNANITFATTESVSGTYSIYVTLERLQ